MGQVVKSGPGRSKLWAAVPSRIKSEQCISLFSIFQWSYFSFSKVPNWEIPVNRKCARNIEEARLSAKKHDLSEALERGGAVTKPRRFRLIQLQCNNALR